MSRLLIIALLCFLSTPSHASEEAFRSTPYPLPRFVSLRSDEVYVRSGPGRKYPVEWVFKKQGLPVEIILEYDNWRKIKYFDGASGWIHHSLLSGKRTALITENDLSLIYEKPNNESRLAAKLESKLVVALRECKAHWCEVEVSGYSGWIKKSALWGVYEHEKFD